MIVAHPLWVQLLPWLLCYTFRTRELLGVPCLAASFLVNSLSRPGDPSCSN